MIIGDNFKRPAFLSLLLALGCGDPDRFDRAASESSDGGEDPIEVELDEAAVLASGMDYQSHLQRLSDAPELSETHSDAASVMVWGSPEAAERFLSIDPMDPTQEVVFEEGTMFVKEHFDEAGENVGLTMMYKGPEGYDSATRDWFWARVRGTEVTHSGRVDFCADCHEAAHNSDFVVGFGKSE